MLGPQSGIPSVTNATPAAGTRLTDAPAKGSMWGPDGFTFGDLVDIVNPLQHFPVVSWAYRALTGDQIAPGAKMAGGALFGGAIGFALSAADTVLEEVTGRDAGTTAVAMLAGRGRESVPPPAPEVMVADAGPAPTADGTPTLSEDQFARLLNGFGPTAAAPSAAPAVAAKPPAPAWQAAAATMSDEQVALLLRSVGLPPKTSTTPANETTVTVAPAGQIVVPATVAMPALPVTPVLTTELAPPKTADEATDAVSKRRAQLSQAAADGDELRRLFGQPAVRP